MKGSERAGTPVSSVTTLAMPAGSGMSVALFGTATEVSDGGVTIDVDRWYAGGDADVVRLTNYDASTVSLDGLSFEPGSRYLVTATRGTINLCGFSGPWNPDLADAFQRAFGS